ncbi:glycosyltransferase [uncultured Lutibacter sp.]|uniref:glycosyltransferase n=1 Tax=uncultured Lutibacter sp. TaxID=437739 RepID=UPI00260827B7|nr:glycosyltransferase [uncultured Lutibacter sp.]
MVKRKRIGLIFSYNENWIGGTYYFLNLIHALNLLQDKNKPIVSIITNDIRDYNYLKNETNYKYLHCYNTYKRISLFKRIVNKVLKSIGYPSFFETNSELKKLDMVYKYYAEEFFIDFENCVYWIPDFQEKYLPQYFKKEEIDSRQKYYESIASNKKFVCFSSKTSLNHFELLFPNSNIKKYVIQFAVTHPNYKKLNDKKVLKKYEINGDFYFSPNQFWEHKNHIVVLKAIKILKNKGINILVVFSGKENDYRNKDYVINLKKYIQENQLENYVKFLGFIPREDQLLIMKNAKAVIQPSYFEGWSTVVEDVKAVNNFILLSNIEVHREQMNSNCDFFEPNNENQLALLMEKYIISSPEIKKIDYNINRKKFSQDFVELINEVTS